MEIKEKISENVYRVTDWIDGELGRACVVLLDFSKINLKRFENEKNIR